jgi:hypothetical protein
MAMSHAWLPRISSSPARNALDNCAAACAPLLANPRPQPACTSHRSAPRCPLPAGRTQKSPRRCCKPHSLDSRARRALAGNNLPKARRQTRRPKLCRSTPTTPPTTTGTIQHESTINYTTAYPHATRRSIVRGARHLVVSYLNTALRPRPRARPQLYCRHTTAARPTRYAHANAPSHRTRASSRPFPSPKSPSPSPLCSRAHPFPPLTCHHTILKKCQGFARLRAPQHLPRLASLHSMPVRAPLCAIPTRARDPIGLAGPLFIIQLCTYIHTYIHVWTA